VGDLAVAGLHHARLLLSPHASARISGWDAAEALATPGVVAVLSAADLRAVATPTAAVHLADGQVRYAGEPVALIVGESEAAAEDGAAKLVIDYKVMPAVVDAFEAIAAGAPAVLPEDEASDDDTESHGAAVAGSGIERTHPNIAGETKLEVGDVGAAFAVARHVVKGRWSMPAVHQAPMETAVTVVRPEPDGGVTVWASTQAPFAVRTDVAAALGLAPADVRVHSQPLGGGFGMKAMAVYEVITALAARAIGRPLRLQLTRSEQFQVCMSGAAVADIELAADAQGNFLGAKIDAWFDSGVRKGGYSRGAAVLMCGAYRLPAYTYHGRDVVTNKPPAYPYRAPSAICFYHLESAIDLLARKMGADPIELRLQNASRGGDPSPVGKWPVFGFVECLEAARRHPLATAPTQPGEAIGVAAGLWTGVGGPAFAGCLVEPDGGVTLQVGYADVSGTDTSLAVLAGEVLGIPPERIKVEVADTRSQPFSGQGGGSRTIYVIGAAVVQAAGEARRQLLALASEVLEAAPEDLRIRDGRVHVAGAESRAVPIPELIQMSSQLFTKYDHGPIYGVGRLAINDPAPMATVHLCRVRVDQETGEWRILEIVAIQDVGRAINVPEIEGQIHGGALQSAGRALGEALIFDAEGTPRSTNFGDYQLPTIDQAPAFQVELVEVPSASGPLGARGVGEPPMIPAVAAIANAVRRATGEAMATVPLEWEEIALTAARPRASLAPA
jgi:CO/xanthine dehydrogenase Mo-binding subunit